MKKNLRPVLIAVLFVSLTTVSCLTGNASGIKEEKYAYEKGVDPEKPWDYTMIIVQRELAIEYLDGLRTSFWSNKIYVKPGDRKIGFRFINSYRLTGLVEMDTYLMSGATYELGFTETPDGMIHFTFQEKSDLYGKDPIESIIK